MQSRKDFELYEAIRHLSILKELPNPDPEELKRATHEVEYKQANLGEPSEMALLSRLHWWTVEYGLIGTLENPKIYGAGLLSSIGESVSCLEPNVKKLWYSVDAAQQAFDITTKQPQLFVCRDFQHLSDVLEEFASRMAYRVGGLEGLQQGDRMQARRDCAVFVRPAGDRRFHRSAHRRQAAADLSAHDWPDARSRSTTNSSTDTGKDHHAEGFGAPIGRWRNWRRD